MRLPLDQPLLAGKEIEKLVSFLPGVVPLIFQIDLGGLRIEQDLGADLGGNVAGKSKRPNQKSVKSTIEGCVRALSSAPTKATMPPETEVHLGKGIK